MSLKLIVTLLNCFRKSIPNKASKLSSSLGVYATNLSLSVIRMLKGDIQLKTIDKGNLTDDDIKEAVNMFKEYVMNETLATEITFSENINTELDLNSHKAGIITKRV